MTSFFAEGFLRKRIPTTFGYLPRILAHLTGIVLVTMVFSVAAIAQARAKRIVVIKLDGLPYEMVERFAREHDPATGKSLLPWFDNVFFQNGTRLTNFYVRGMSLSAPTGSFRERRSW